MSGPSASVCASFGNCTVCTVARCLVVCPKTPACHVLSFHCPGDYLILSESETQTKILNDCDFDRDTHFALSISLHMNVVRTVELDASFRNIVCRCLVTFCLPDLHVEDVSVKQQVFRQNAPQCKRRAGPSSPATRRLFTCACVTPADLT